MFLLHFEKLVHFLFCLGNVCFVAHCNDLMHCHCGSFNAGLYFLVTLLNCSLLHIGALEHVKVVNLFLTNTLLQVKLKNMLYHTARINCLAWSPNSSMVATGSLDTCVIIYEVDKPASSRLTVKGAHLGGVYGLAFTDDYSVVSSGEDACVRVWKLTPQ